MWWIDNVGLPARFPQLQLGTPSSMSSGNSFYLSEPQSLLCQQEWYLPRRAIMMIKLVLTSVSVIQSALNTVMESTVSTVMENHETEF